MFLYYQLYLYTCTTTADALKRKNRHLSYANGGMTKNTHEYEEASSNSVSCSRYMFISRDIIREETNQVF